MNPQKNTLLGIFMVAVAIGISAFTGGFQSETETSTEMVEASVFPLQSAGETRFPDVSTWGKSSKPTLVSTEAEESLESSSRYGIESIQSDIEDIKAMVSESCECKCECPTADEIAEAVSKKLKEDNPLSAANEPKAPVTVQSSAPVQSSTVTTLAGEILLNPGEVLTSVNGVPVSSGYSSAATATSAPVKAYRTPLRSTCQTVFDPVRRVWTRVCN